MGTSCCHPSDEEMQGDVIRVAIGTDEAFPDTQANNGTGLAESACFNPKGVGFIFKAQEPEKLVFHEDRKDEILDPNTDPRTVSKAWYGDLKEEWSEARGVDVLTKVQKFLKEGKQVSADNNLFGDPAPKIAKVLLIEKTFSIKSIDMTRKPLGMKFREEIPIIITNVLEDGNAKKLGVQVGWELIKVGDDDLIGKSYGEVYDLIKAAINKMN